MQYNAILLYFYINNFTLFLYESYTGEKKVILNRYHKKKEDWERM